MASDPIFLNPQSPIILGGTPKKSRLQKFLGFPAEILKAELRFITSPKLTVALAGTLGTLLGGPIGGLKAAGVTALTVGVLETSPRARKFLGEKLKDPTQAGRFVGEQIEKLGEPSQDKRSVGEKVREGLVKAGILGGVAAAGVAGVVVAKKVRERIREAKGPKIPEVRIPSFAPPQFVSPQLPGLIPDISPVREVLGAAEAPEPEKEEKIIPTPQIPTKIIIKPKISNVIQIQNL